MIVKGNQRGPWRRRTRLLRLAGRAVAMVAAAIVVVHGAARAQPATPPTAPASTDKPTELPTPPEPSASQPLPPPPPPPIAAACVPSCRAGFMCVQGACVSACNPPCASSEVCSAQGECKASAPPPPPPPVESPKREDAPGVRTHDGFFFRIALGPGAFFGSGTERDNGRDSHEGSINGFALVGELSFGGTVGRGVVLGGGNWNAVALSPTMKGKGLNPATVETEVRDPVVLPFGLVGPFLDWYVNPKEGFHIQTAVGLATGGYEEPGDNEDTIFLTGIGGMIGLGHEWWIGEQWSMGILARGTFGSLSGTDPTDPNEEHSAILASPGVLLTFSYH
jgi:hypothetical protein